MSENKTIIPIVENYDELEELLYIKPYMFIKGYAKGKNLNNTLLALPLARRVHNGQYRKSTTELLGKSYKTPYIMHCLKVCSTIISLELNIPNERLDILLASALLHDVLEDGPEFFPKEGQEFMTEYGLDKEILTVVSLLSKEAGSSEHELSVYFNKIKKNELALIIKLADRSHNVEDLYNMKIEKLHKYETETRNFIYPLTRYGKEVYPKNSDAFTLLKSKIVSLVELTETLVSKYDAELEVKNTEIKELSKNQKLEEE